MSQPKQRAIILAVVALSALTMIILISCISEKDKPMTPEEIKQANTAIILEHYAEIGYQKDGPRSQEGMAEATAGWLMEVTDKLIASIDSELQENGSLTLHVTDEGGRYFVLYFNARGSLSHIEDGNGEIVFQVKM